LSLNGPAITRVMEPDKVKRVQKMSEIAKNDLEWQLLVDLAATFRMIAHLDWHEGVANHFSAAVSEDGKRFILNPKWRHFSMIRASDLLVLDADDASVMELPDAPDPTAWHIHSALHTRLPETRCVLHLHPPYATALSCLTDPEIKPIDQTTARFFNGVSYDSKYSGMADDANEGLRLAHILGKNKILMMGNHGVLVTAQSIAIAFDTLYHLERACRTLMLAYSTGREIRFLSTEVAQQTAKDWELFTDGSLAHFDEAKRVMTRLDPSYAD
jgi:ribulose-5-phosphate 4-epimerase/fuculose-1-phosphate aldolase